MQSQRRPTHTESSCRQIAEPLLVHTEGSNCRTQAGRRNVFLHQTSIFQSTQFFVKVYYCFPWRSIQDQRTGANPSIHLVYGETQIEKQPRFAHQTPPAPEAQGMLAGCRALTETSITYSCTTEPFRIAWWHLSATHGLQPLVRKNSQPRDLARSCLLPSCFTEDSNKRLQVSVRKMRRGRPKDYKHLA